MPKKPVITFDLDGVIVRPPLGINPGSKIHKPRDAEGKRGILWLTERWRYAGRRPMPGAIEGLSRLTLNFDCRLLSARGEAARPITERWLSRYLGSIPPLHLRPDWHETPAQFKTRMVRELGAVAHFEDDPHTAAWVSELVRAVFLVDWRRNRALPDRENIFRVRSVLDAVGRIDELGLSSEPWSR